MSGKMTSGQTKEVRRELYRYLWKSPAGKWISSHADPMQECACNVYRIARRVSKAHWSKAEGGK